MKLAYYLKTLLKLLFLVQKILRIQLTKTRNLVETEGMNVK